MQKGKVTGLLAAMLLATASWSVAASVSAGVLAAPAAAPATTTPATTTPAAKTSAPFFADMAPGTAIRTDAGTYALHWRGLEGPVSITVAATPDAPVAAQQLVASNVKGNYAEVPVKFTGRPYFTLTTASGQTLRLAERLLPLEGGRNFRDLGGYQTADGQQVRWGLLFRSGAMAGLTAADQQYLEKLGLRQVCDFRTTSERQQEPATWLQAGGPVNYWTRDYEMSGADFSKVLSGKMTGAQARADFTNMYRGLPYEQKTAYHAMFRMLVSGDAPLAFNCTAGKDRAGLAAALVLSALGVPRATVMADYEMTNRYLSPTAFEKKPTEAAAPKDGTPDFRTFLKKVSPEVVHALLVADPVYLEAAFQSMEARDGSVEGYLNKTLGLTAADMKLLRERYLD